MKFTQYFLYMRQRPDRAKIKMEWIEQTVKNADYTEVQSDGRIRKWKKIEDQDKFLRVVLLADGETIHNTLTGASGERGNESQIFLGYRYSACRVL